MPKIEHFARHIDLSTPGESSVNLFTERHRNFKGLLHMKIGSYNPDYAVLARMTENEVEDLIAHLQSSLRFMRSTCQCPNLTHE